MSVLNILEFLRARSAQLKIAFFILLGVLVIFDVLLPRNGEHAVSHPGKDQVISVTPAVADEHAVSKTEDKHGAVSQPGEQKHAPDVANSKIFLYADNLLTYSVQRVPAFWTIFTLVGCFLLIKVSKGLAHTILGKKEDFYG